jgi:hypothetical protein
VAERSAATGTDQKGFFASRQGRWTRIHYRNNPSLAPFQILLANSELASFCDIVATKKWDNFLNCPANHEEKQRDNLKNCPTQQFASVSGGYASLHHRLQSRAPLALKQFASKIWKRAYPGSRQSTL